MPDPPVDPFAYLLGLEQFGVKLGLGNIDTITRALGHPERTYPTIHIAGTNGKGSVAAMVESALRAAGHRTGRYTSPHLVSLTERISIDGEAVSMDALGQAVSEVRDVVQRLQATGQLTVHPTFFEVTTATAFELFRRAGVAVGVCEVGLGGRFDATNVVQPIVTAITSIGLDHERHLGHSLHEIAREKAGIVKPAIPVIVGDVAEEAARAIAETARQRGAPLIRASEGVSVQEVAAEPPLAADQSSFSLPPERLRVRTPVRDYGEVVLALAGAHQVRNALVAVRVLEIADRQGLAVQASDVRAGLEQVRWPGRLDVRTLPDGREALLDAAHNTDGARALAAHVRSRFPGRYPLVFAAMRDKDASGMLRHLLPLASCVVFTRAANPRSADPVELAALARTLAPDLPTRVDVRPADALASAWAIAPRVVVAGSIFLLGHVIEELERP